MCPRHACAHRFQFDSKRAINIPSFYFQIGGSICWNHPIDLHYFTTTIQGWPRLPFEVWRLDEHGGREVCTRMRVFSFASVMPARLERGACVLVHRPFGTFTLASFSPLYTQSSQMDTHSFTYLHKPGITRSSAPCGGRAGVCARKSHVRVACKSVVNAQAGRSIFSLIFLFFVLYVHVSAFFIGGAPQLKNKNSLYNSAKVRFVGVVSLGFLNKRVAACSNSHKKLCFRDDLAG